MSSRAPRTGQWLLFEPIYRFNVALLCCPADEAKKRIRRVLPEDTAAELDSCLDDLACAGRFMGTRHPTTGLIATFWISPSADVPVIAHEVLHATFWVLKEKGLTLDDSSEEAYTYFIEWLTREIVKRRERPVV